jgi:nucleoside 2-deoxyribosyltransferase
VTTAGHHSGRVFLAAPFTQFISSDGVVEAPARSQLSTLRAALMANGHSVFLAHEREAWGAELMTPQQCTPLDFAEMQETDVVCAYLGEPPSYGVHIELGWASALDKPILLLVNSTVAYSPLVWGLSEMTEVRVLEVNGLLEDSTAEILEGLGTLLKGREVAYASESGV